MERAFLFLKCIPYQSRYTISSKKILTTMKTLISILKNMIKKEEEVKTKIYVNAFRGDSLHIFLETNFRIIIYYHFELK